MRKLGFTLIELIIVVLIIGVVSYLAVKLPSFYFSSDTGGILDALKPNGEITVYKNGDVVSDKKVVFKCEKPEVFVFENGNFEKKTYEKENEKQPVFKYRVENGIGESLILHCSGKWYVFKPFSVKGFDSFEEASSVFLNKEYFPKMGSYY